MGIFENLIYIPIAIFICAFFIICEFIWGGK